MEENNKDKDKDKEKSPPTPPDVPDEKNAPMGDPKPDKKIITRK